MKLNSIDLGKLGSDLDQQINGVKESSDLEMVRRDWLGKEGVIKTLFKQLSTIDAADRPGVAAKLNELKVKVGQFVASKEEAFKNQEREKTLAQEFLDLSLPSSSPGFGRIHPITFVERKVSEVLSRFGFKVVYGPEIETEYFCFDSLNIPPHHPARDMQDTFFTQGCKRILRTHTTSVQARALKEGELPVRVCSPGRVYRNETEDASHQAMFHQYELIWVEKGLTLSNLMALMVHIAKSLYGKRRKIRFVPKFYPYTEPSLGLAVACVLCNGKGCSMCGGAGWATVVGAGMVHANVLREFKYDPTEVNGFAFGFGTTRLAAQLFNLPRGKMLYENDLRVFREL